MQIINRRVRRNAIRQLRTKLKGWGREIIKEVVPRKGQVPLVVERRVSIQELILASRDADNLATFLKDKRVGAAEESLYTIARS